MPDERTVWWTLWSNDRGEYRTVEIETDGTLAAALASAEIGRAVTNGDLEAGAWEYCCTLSRDGETVMDIAQLAVATCELGVAAGLWDSKLPNATPAEDNDEVVDGGKAGAGDGTTTNDDAGATAETT